MKQDVSGAKHFHEALAATPKDLRQHAQRLGTSAAAVSRWLGGGHNFTLSTLARISVVLDVPLISVPN